MNNDELFNMLSVWVLVVRWWWVWFAGGITGVLIMSGFIAFTPVAPVATEYASDAVLLATDSNSAVFYSTVADIWFADFESVGHTRATTGVVIEVSLRVRRAVAPDAALSELIVAMVAQGQQLRALQSAERLDAARALTAFNGVDVLIDPSYLAPSLGTLTVLRPPSAPRPLTPEVGGLTHMSKMAFAGLMGLVIAITITLSVEYFTKIRTEFKHLKGEAI